MKMRKYTSKNARRYYDNGNSVVEALQMIEKSCTKCKKIWR
ncbi:MAG: hypothetical protein ACLVIY_07590 [Anaerobutyricum soehngenii]